MSSRLLLLVGFIMAGVVGGPLAGLTSHYLDGDPATAVSVRDDGYCGDSVRDDGYCQGSQEQEQWQWQSAQNSTSIGTSGGAGGTAASGGGSFGSSGGGYGYGGSGYAGGYGTAASGGGTTIINVNQSVNQSQGQWQSQDVCCTGSSPDQPAVDDGKIDQPSGPPITGPSNPVGQPTTPPQ